MRDRRTGVRGREGGRDIFCPQKVNLNPFPFAIACTHTWLWQGRSGCFIKGQQRGGGTLLQNVNLLWQSSSSSSASPYTLAYYTQLKARERISVDRQQSAHARLKNLNNSSFVRRGGHKPWRLRTWMQENDDNRSNAAVGWGGFPSSSHECGMFWEVSQSRPLQCTCGIINGGVSLLQVYNAPV